MRGCSKRLMALSGVLLFLFGCGNEEPASGEPGAGGSAASAGVAGAMGGASGTTGGASGNGGAGATTGGSSCAPTSGGSGNTGGTPKRPPNPRTDIGPPDGVHCEGDIGPAVECAVGQQCCQAGVADTANECVAPGTTCQNCRSPQCGGGTCDGPEDCPGQLCCYTQISCRGAGAPCISTYGIAKCQDRCEGLNPDEIVVCRDARDCLDPIDQCVRRSLLPDISTCAH